MRIRLNQNLVAVFGKTLIAILLCLSPVVAYGQGMGGMMGGGGDMGMGGMGMGSMNEQPPLELAKGALYAAKTDQQRQAAIKKIQKELATDYDQFLLQNERQLKQMQDRLQRLHAQLKRRKDAKSQLVSLELQRIVNEADGLVWPADQSGGMGIGGSPGMGMGFGGSPGMGMGSGGGMSGGGGMGGGMSGGGMDDGFDDFQGGRGAGGISGDEGEEGMDFDEMTTEATTAALGRETSSAPIVPVQPAILHGGSQFNEKMSTREKLRAMVLACLNHEAAYEQFPSNIVDDQGKPLLSWRVTILPMLGRAELYNKFHLDEPWDSEHNIKLLDEMPEPKTTLLGFDGPTTIFESGEVTTFAKITDGSSNTITCALANDDAAVEWSKPSDIKFVLGKKVTELALMDNGEYSFAMADASNRTVLASKLSQEQLGSLIQARDGKIVPDLK